MTAQIVQLNAYIADERALLALCTDVKREEMITQRLLSSETSRQSLANLLTVLIQGKKSQSGKQ